MMFVPDPSDYLKSFAVSFVAGVVATIAVSAFGHFMLGRGEAKARRTSH